MRRPLLLAVPLLVACSSSGNTGLLDAGPEGSAGTAGSGAGAGGGGAGAGGAAAGSGGGGGTGGAAGGAGAAGAGGTTSAPAYLGRVTLGLVPNGSMSVSAAFDGADGHPEQCTSGTCRCQLAVEPPCMLNRCSAAAAPVQLTVGDITVSAGGATLGVATANGTAYVGSVAADAVVPGTAVTVTASGGDVPGFTVTLVTPEPVSLLTPAEGTLLPRAAGVPLTWAGLATVARFDLYESDADPLFAYCELPGGGGSGLLPAVVTTQFAAGPATLQGFAVTATEVRVGDWSVRVSLVNARMLSARAVTLQ